MKNIRITFSHHIMIQLKRISKLTFSYVHLGIFSRKMQRHLLVLWVLVQPQLNFAYDEAYFFFKDAVLKWRKGQEPHNGGVAISSFDNSKMLNLSNAKLLYSLIISFLSANLVNSIRDYGFLKILKGSNFTMIWMSAILFGA